MAIKTCDTLVTVTCQYCQKPNDLAVNGADFAAYQAGELFVQQAFPYLAPAERELFISGMCGTCWEQLMGGFED